MTRKRFWPDATQELILGTCLHHDRAAAIQSWKEWKARVDLDDLDRSSFQILSLVFRRLLELGIEDPDLRRIKGVHRYRWTQNHLASRGRRELLNALHGENIPAMLLRGAALGQTVYPEPATRGVHDMDVVVPVETAARAVGLLRASGWNAKYFDPTWTLECSDACELLHSDYGAANIRWRVMQSRCPTGREEELWRAARPFEYEQIPTRILCPADQFLHACEHGMHHSSVSGLQWLVDCAFIIRHSPPPFDWARLIDQSNKFQLSLPVRQAVGYLRKHFENSIPGEVIAAMERSPVTLDNRIEYFLAGRPDAKQQDLTHKLGAAACRYIKLKHGGRFRQFLRDFPRFLRLLAARARGGPALSRKE
jgi:hypothetical protein